MPITIQITDEKQLAHIEKLRGDIPAEEFLRRVIGAGLRVAAAELEQMKSGKGRINFAATKSEFKALDVKAITEALKDKDPKHPVKIEVGRLVQNYTAQLGAHAKKNGNRLPASLKVSAQSAIEKVAFQITVEGIKNAVKQNKKSA